MIVTVSGLSGLTNAYTSVLSATGSLLISGASRCDDMLFCLSVGVQAQRAASSRRFTVTSLWSAFRTYAVTGSYGAGPDGFVTTGGGAPALGFAASIATAAIFGVAR